MHAQDGNLQLVFCKLTQHLVFSYFALRIESGDVGGGQVDGLSLASSTVARILEVISNNMLFL